MPTGLKITVLFNCFAIAVLLSVTVKSPGESNMNRLNQSPAPTRSKGQTQLKISMIQQESSSSASRLDNPSKHDYTSDATERDAIPAPWIIADDGSVTLKE